VLGRKIFTALLVSLFISLLLAIIEGVLSRTSEPLVMLVFVFAIYIGPVVFVYGVLVSIFAEKFSSGYTQLAIHIGFGLLFFIPLNLFALVVFHKFIGVNLVYVLLSGLAGGLLYFVDRIVNYFWKKNDLKGAIIVVDVEEK